MTDVLRLTGDAGHDDELLRRAAAVLRDGGTVAFPTETVYGLGALAWSADAVRKVFEAKGRASDDPLIVHVLADWPLDDVYRDPPAELCRLARAYWPGPLTLVGPRAAHVPLEVTAGLDSVAARSPAHPVAQRLIELTGAPVAAPSANRFTYVSPTTAQHVLDDLDGRIDVVVDGGATPAGIESTVLRVEDDGTFTVLRHGALPVEWLTEEDPARFVEPDAHADRSASPGRTVKHYSPRTRTVAAVARPAADALAGIAAHPELAGSAGGPVRYLGYGDAPAVLPPAWESQPLGERADLAGVARALYAALRAADGAGAGLIVIELCGEPGLGRAIDDRIRRAASGVVLGSP
jgi:L-threonylcarbamoyladenylate synthase